MEISVVVATYNQLEYLPKVMGAWNKQTFKDYSLYLVDDGSTDGTKEWAKKNAKKLNFKYFWQENKGMRLARSINNALKVATGEYALFAMADSVPIATYLEEMKPWLDKNWVLCGVRENVDEDLNHIGWDWRFRGRESSLPLKFIPIRAFHTGRITGNGFLVPMWALKKIGYWPEDFVGYSSEDNYLMAQLFAEGLEVAETPQAILKHIEHPIREENIENKELLKGKLPMLYKKLAERLRPQTVCLNFDDFSPVNNNLFFLRKLKQNYPKLKVSLFIIPATTQTGSIETLTKHLDFCDELRKESDWIELLPHGWHHPDRRQGPPEFMDMSYFDTKNYIKMVDVMFKEVNLPYKKIFKAPQYAISRAAKDCFRDNGWVLAVDGEGELWPEDMKIVTWNWNISAPFQLRKTVISYGHIQDIGNGMIEYWHHLLQIPSDVNFKFLSEVVDEKIGLPKSK